MEAYKLTPRGYELLKKGTSRIAELLKLAEDVAEDGVVSEDELISKADMTQEEAEATLNMLQRLGLIQ